MLPRQSFSALASSASAQCASGPDCKCCRAIEQARSLSLFDPLPHWRSPLTPGVQLVNLSRSTDRRILRVELGKDWARMVSQLPQIGRGLVMTASENAILGTRTRYPGVQLADEGNAGLWLDFRKFQAARAVHLRRKTGHAFGAEFIGRNGEVAHWFALTAESDLDEFFAWVRLHQACSADRDCASPAPAGGEPQTETSRVLRDCRNDFVRSVIAACCDREVMLRATVFAKGARQRAEFIPRSLRQNENWIIALNGAAELHIQPDRFASVTLEQRFSTAGRESVVIRIAGLDHATTLILEAGSHASDRWVKALEAAA